MYVGVVIAFVVHGMSKVHAFVSLCGLCVVCCQCCQARVFWHIALIWACDVFVRISCAMFWYNKGWGEVLYNITE